MTPLPGRTQSLRYEGQTHSDLSAISDFDQGLRLTGGDTRQIFTEMTSYLVWENDWGTVLLIEYNRSMRTGFGTVAAASAPLQKDRLRNGSRRTEPICPRRRRGLFSRRVLMLDELMRRLGNRDD